MKLTGNQSLTRIPSSSSGPRNASSENLRNTSSTDPFYGLSFKVGVAENKNTTYRNKMEDVHTYIANFAERVDWGYFAIFDGHAGKDTARWCGNNLHRLVEEEVEVGGDLKDGLGRAFVRGDEEIEREGVGSSGCTAAVAVMAWEKTTSSEESTSSEKPSEVDSSAVKTSVEPNSSGAISESISESTTSGATGDPTIDPNGDPTNGTEISIPPHSVTNSANSGSRSTGSKFDFIPSKNHRRMLYTSNVGDLRVILYRKGQPYRLSYDHKATDINEINRIRDTGGLIMKNRVNGVLAVTRSLGDSYMKDLVIGKPFTTSTEITADDEFMILACDGVWDVISDLKACEFVSDLFERGSGKVDPQIAAKKLCQLAMDNSTTDNVTVMIVKFDKDVFVN
jgi:protein phosphatase PTC1